ncbi:MAG: DUF6285 domain-containing protein [Anaerolineae bacterium]
MQDRPDARELVEAVGIFLQRELIPTIADPRLRFRALVAANVLSIVARELQEGSEPLHTEWERLTGLLGKGGSEAPATDRTLRDAVLELNRELAARIRAGEMDAAPFYAAALDHVEATVVAKLRVANPRYLERISANP